MNQLYHEKNEDRWPRILTGTLDFIATDVPYLASELTDGEDAIKYKNRADVKRDMGEWDKAWSPLYTLEQAARCVRPGGWFITCSGDVIFGMIREMGERSKYTLRSYIRFLRSVDILSGTMQYIALTKLSEGILHQWEYHCTIAWHKTNPVCRARLSGPQSSLEWIQVLKRLDDKGKSVAGTWNPQPQDRRGHNFLEWPRCSEPERLYWHNLNGIILTCPGRRNCNLCAEDAERLNHPTQKPLYLWRWLFERFTVPGQKGYDPYAGLGTSLMVADESKFGLEMIGSEKKYEFWKAAQLWRTGGWAPSRQDLAAGQQEMFDVHG